MRVAKARHRDDRDDGGGGADSPPASRSGVTSGSSSLGLDTSGVSGRLPWARAVQLCRDTDLSIGGLVLQASSSDDVSEVSCVAGATPREREFLGYYADFASSAATSRCTSAVTSETDNGRPPAAAAAAASSQHLASQLGHVVLALAERYDDVLATPSLHASFVAALASCTPVSETASDELSTSGSDTHATRPPQTATAIPAAATATVDMAAVAAFVAKGVGRTFPGADPAHAGSRTWFENHTQLLTCIYNTARELVIPATCPGAPSTPPSHESPSSTSGATSPDSADDSLHPRTAQTALHTPSNLPRLSGGAGAVAACIPVLERTTDLLNRSLAIEELPHLQRNPAFLACLARILTMSSVVDPSALPEGLTASLNECFAKCTRGMDALLARPGDGLPVVQAILDDLARGLNARRYVMPRIVDLSRDAIGRHAVVAFLDHTAKVSKGVGTDVLQAASPELLREAGADAPSLLLEQQQQQQAPVPTLVAMACHPQACVVVPAILKYADGYHAVAFSEALHAHAESLLESNRAAAALAWCAANPAFKDAVIVSHNRLGRDLVIQRADISASAGIKAIDSAIAGTPSGVVIAPHKVTGRVCFTFAETGACATGIKCPLLHVDGAVVTALCNRDCCLQHGSPAFVAASAAPMATVTSDKDPNHALRIICTADHSRTMSIAPSQLSFTAGLAVYVARDHNIGLPIESDALCRQHSRCCCQKPQQCKYIHVCREVYAAVAEWTAPPPKEATVTSPTATASQPPAAVAEKASTAGDVAAPPRNANATRPPKKNAAAANPPDATPPPGNARCRPVSGGLPPRSAASSLSDLAAATATGRKPMELPANHRRTRHTPYSSTPTGAPSTSAFDNRSPSVSSASTSNRFITHVDASPPGAGTSMASIPPPGAGLVPAGLVPADADESPPRDSRIRPLTNFVTPDLRGHARQVSDYSNGHFSVGSNNGASYNNVSESPLAVAMGSAAARGKDSRRPSGNARSLGGGRSVTSASGSVSHGAHTTSDLGGVHPSFGGYGFALGPGHSTPRGGRHSSQTPTTNHTV